MIQGYVTTKGIVFTTAMRIVRKNEIVAEPGDICTVEGTVLHNLSHAERNDPRMSFQLDGLTFASGRVQ